MKSDETHESLWNRRMSPTETNPSTRLQFVADQTNALGEAYAAHVHPPDRIASQAELRAFVRRKGKGKLTYEIGDSRIAPSHRAALVDISENGLGIITDQPLEVGMQLRISLETPHQGQSVSLLAEVRWVTALAESQFRAGCNLERRLAYTEMQHFLR